MTQSILRPMSLVEILDETFDLYRRNFVLFVGIGVLAMLPIRMVEAVVFSAGRSIAWIWYPITILIVWIMSSLAQGVMIWAASRCCLNEQPTILQSFKSFPPIFRPYLLTTLQVVLAEMLAFAAGVVFTTIITLPFTLTDGSSSPPNTGYLPLLIVTYCLPAAISCLAFAFVSQAMVLERRMYTAAIKRSWQLLNSFRREIWIRVFLLTLVYLAIYYILTGPSMAIDYLIKGHHIGRSLRLLLQVSRETIIILASPIQCIGMILIYYDIRIKKDGLDLHLLLLGDGASGDKAEVASET